MTSDWDRPGLIIIGNPTCRVSDWNLAVVLRVAVGLHIPHGSLDVGCGIGTVRYDAGSALSPCPPTECELLTKCEDLITNKNTSGIVVFLKLVQNSLERGQLSLIPHGQSLLSVSSLIHTPRSDTRCSVHDARYRYGQCHLQDFCRGFQVLHGRRRSILPQRWGNTSLEVSPWPD